MSHNQNPVKRSRAMLQESRRGPQLILVGTFPYEPSSTQVLIGSCSLHLWNSQKGGFPTKRSKQRSRNPAPVYVSTHRFCGAGFSKFCANAIHQAPAREAKHEPRPTATQLAKLSRRDLQRCLRLPGWQINPGELWGQCQKPDGPIADHSEPTEVRAASKAKGKLQRGPRQRALGSSKGHAFS